MVWLTGLSGSGKTTLARELARDLAKRGIPHHVLDGDLIRAGLNRDLGFTHEDRTENVRRIAHVAALFADAGITAIAGLISPYRADRDSAREIVESRGHRFLEVYVNAPISLCEQRDPKGLYARARTGEVPNFTGVSAPYEAPEAPDLELRPAEDPYEMLSARLLELVLSPPAGSRTSEDLRSRPRGD